MRRLVVVAVAALVLGALLGRATGSPSPDLRSPAAGNTSKGAGAGSGPPPRSRQGAIEAAGRAQQAFADSEVLRRGELRRRVEELATPEFAETMLRANAPGSRRLWSGAFGAGLRAGIPSTYTAVPVYYRLASYSSERAIVETWGFTLLGNAAALEPTAYFGRARTTLRWVEGGWRIADTEAAFGPTPRLAGPRAGGEGFGLLAMTKEMRRYGIAP